MLKKSLVLMMVFGLVGVANASVVWRIEVEGIAINNKEVHLGEIVTFTIGSNASTNGSTNNFKLIISHSINGTIKKLGNWLLDPSPMSVATSGDAQIFSCGTGTLNIPSPAGDYLQLTFTVPTNQGLKYGDIITITSAGSFLGYPNPINESLTVVPEPMTVTFLGLGGLLLRRRIKLNNVFFKKKILQKLKNL